MSARIVTDDIFFKGNCLGIPPLRERIFSMSGDISEREVIAIAEDLYNEYQNVYKYDNEKWAEISHNKVETNLPYNWTVWRCRRELRQLINKYANYITSSNIETEDNVFVNKVRRIAPLQEKVLSFDRKLSMDEVLEIARNLYDAMIPIRVKNKSEEPFLSEEELKQHNDMTQHISELKSLLKEYSHEAFEFYIKPKPAALRIISENQLFIGSVLGNPLLKNRLHENGGEITEGEVISIAEELFIKCEDLIHNEKEKWDRIKDRMVKTRNSSDLTLKVCRTMLKSFLKNFQTVNLNSGHNDTNNGLSILTIDKDHNCG